MTTAELKYVIKRMSVDVAFWIVALAFAAATYLIHWLYTFVLILKPDEPQIGYIATLIACGFPCLMFVLWRFSSLRLEYKYRNKSWK